jgi:alpha-tubulin suppressor-like RCC1 family protein
MNLYGEIGDGTLTPHFIPGIGGLGRTYSAISVGGDHTCGASVDGRLACWGVSDFGQLGEDLADETEPCVYIQDVSTKQATRKCSLGPDFDVIEDGGSAVGALSFSSGGSHSCAVADYSDVGMMLCWGLNTVGQTGINSLSYQPADCTGDAYSTASDFHATSALGY